MCAAAGGEAMLRVVEYGILAGVAGEHIGEQCRPQLVHSQSQADRAVVGGVCVVALFVQHDGVAVFPGCGRVAGDPHCHKHMV